MNILPTVIGFILGCLASYLFAIFNLRNSELTERINDLYKDLGIVADKAAEYWLMNGDNEKLPLLEAQIIGLQHRIITMVTQLSDTWWHIHPLLESDLDAFVDALTGGDFQVSGRKADLSRALSSQMTAGNLMNGLRRVRRGLIRSF